MNGDQVRDRIDAAMSYPQSEGFSDVEDPSVLQKDAFDSRVYTITAEFEGARKFLKISYAWLEERSARAVTKFLVDRDIGRSLKQPDTQRCTIEASGLLNWQ